MASDSSPAAAAIGPSPATIWCHPLAERMLLGENVANELVDWFNQVDATYRAGLRELNELNFARFHARQEQRLAKLEADLRTEFIREIASSKTELLRWAISLWVPVALAVIGLYFKP